jgi:hypothetical protein
MMYSSPSTDLTFDRFKFVFVNTEVQIITICHFEGSNKINIVFNLKHYIMNITGCKKNHRPEDPLLIISIISGRLVQQLSVCS